MSPSLLFGLPSSTAARIVALIIGGLWVDWLLDQSSNAEFYSDVVVYGVVAGVLVWMASQARKRGEAPIAWAAFLVAWALGRWAVDALMALLLFVVRERDWFDPSPELFGVSSFGLASLGVSLAIMLTPLWFAGRWARRHGVALALSLAAVYLLPFAMRAMLQGASMFTYRRGVDFTLALSAIEAVLFVASVLLLFMMLLRLERLGHFVNRNLLVGALLLVSVAPVAHFVPLVIYGFVQGREPFSDAFRMLFILMAFSIIGTGLPILVVWLAARRPSITLPPDEIDRVTS